MYHTASSIAPASAPMPRPAIARLTQSGVPVLVAAPGLRTGSRNTACATAIPTHDPATHQQYWVLVRAWTTSLRGGCPHMFCGPLTFWAAAKRYAHAT